MIVALEPTGEVTMINHKGTRVLGYREDEMVGRDFYEMVVPPGARAELRSKFADLEQYDYSESPVVTKTGDELLIAWHAIPLPKLGLGDRRCADFRYRCHSGAHAAEPGS